MEPMRAALIESKSRKLDLELPSFRGVLVRALSCHLMVLWLCGLQELLHVLELAARYRKQLHVLCPCDCTDSASQE